MPRSVPARVLLVTVAGVLGLLATAPVVAGFALERAWARLLEAADGSAPGLRVEGGFERGLYRSSAHTTIRLEAEGEPAMIELDHVVSHGPLPLAEVWRGRSPFVPVAAVVDTRWDADPVALPRLAAALDGSPMVRVVLWLYFDETLRTELSVPAFALAEGDLRTDGVTATARLDAAARFGRGALRVRPTVIRDGDWMLGVESAALELAFAPHDPEARDEEAPPGGERLGEARLELGAITLAGPGGARVQVAPSHAEATATWVAEVMQRGEMTLVLGDVALSGAARPAAPPRHLRGLRLHETAGLDPASGLRHFETTLAFDALETRDGVHGPGRAVIAVRNIDPAVARGFRSALESLDAATPPGRDPLEARAALLAQWGSKLVASSPEIEIEALEVTSPSGELRGRGRLSFDGEAGPPLGDPSRWLARMRAHLLLRVPAKIVHAAIEAHLMRTARLDMGDASEADLAAVVDFMREATLTQLVARGVLVPEGERYRIEARWQDGQATLNGRPIEAADGPGAAPAP